MDNLLNATGRAVIAISVLLFCAGTIVSLLTYGNPHNSLHESALGWSYGLIGLILAGLGIAAALPSLVKPSPPA